MQREHWMLFISISLKSFDTILLMKYELGKWTVRCIENSCQPEAYSPAGGQSLVKYSRDYRGAAFGMLGKGAEEEIAFPRHSHEI